LPRYICWGEELFRMRTLLRLAVVVLMSNEK